MTALHFGFSLNAGLAVNRHSRADLERLLRYGNRAAFSQKRLSLTPQGRVRLKLRKPTADGRTEICMEPLDFLRRLAALVVPPKFNLTRYHGIFAPNHSSRDALKPLLPNPPPAASSAPEDITVPLPTSDADEDGAQAPYGYSVLLARVFKQDLGDCEKCGGKMRLIACIEHPPTVHRILSHLGLPTEPPKKAPARAPPQLSFAGWDRWKLPHPG